MGVGGLPLYPAVEQAHTDDRRLRDTVQQRTEGQRETRTALLILGGLRLALVVTGALAVPGATPGQPHVARGVRRSARQRADCRRGQPALLVRLPDQLEADRRQQYARTEGHHRRDHLLRHPQPEPHHRPKEQRRTRHQTPTPA